MTGKGAPRGNQYAKKEDRGRTISLYVSGDDISLIRMVLQAHNQPSSDADCIKMAKKAATSGIHQLVLAKKSELEKGRSKMHQVQFEIVTEDQETVNDTLFVEADSEERALEHAANVLEEKYEGGTLLECKVI